MICSQRSVKAFPIRNIVCRRPPQSSETGEQAVNSVHLNPQNVDQIYVCTRAPTIFLMTLQGQVGRGRQLSRLTINRLSASRLCRLAESVLVVQYVLHAVHTSG